MSKNSENHWFLAEQSLSSFHESKGVRSTPMSRLFGELNPEALLPGDHTSRGLHYREKVKKKRKKGRIAHGCYVDYTLSRTLPPPIITLSFAWHNRLHPLSARAWKKWASFSPLLACAWEKWASFKSTLLCCSQFVAFTPKDVERSLALLQGSHRKVLRSSILPGRCLITL